MPGTSLETATLASATAAPPSKDRRWIVLAVLCLSVFLVVVDNTIVNVALPTLNRSLGASITSLQWIVDAYSLAFAGLLLAGGGIGDRLGRKGTMQVGLVFFGLFSAAAAASHTTGTLISSRALMGVAAAFIFPASLAILTSVFPDPSERQKALGIWGATSGIAVAFGPITGGALLEHFWYGSIFLVNVPIVIVTLIAGQVLIPRLPRVAEHPFDIRGVLLSTLGVTSLVLGIIEGPQWGWASTGTLACFAVAAVLLTAFALLELRTDGPLLDVRVFKIPRFSGGALSISVAFFCLFGFIFLITQYFQFVKGYSTLSAGMHTLPFAIVAAIFTPIAAVVALKVGSRLVVTTGLLLMGGGLVVAAFNSEADTSYFGPIIVAMVLLSLGLASHHGADGGSGHGIGARRAAWSGSGSEQHDEGARWHARSGGLRLDLRLVLRPQDHQCVPSPPHPGGPEGRSPPIHGGHPGRGRPCPARRATGSAIRGVHCVPQRVAGGVHRRSRRGPHGRRGRIPAPAGPGRRRSGDGEGARAVHGRSLVGQRLSRRLDSPIRRPVERAGRRR